MSCKEAANHSMSIFRSSRGYYVLVVNGKEIGYYDTFSEAVNDYENEYRNNEESA